MSLLKTTRPFSTMPKARPLVDQPAAVPAIAGLDAPGDGIGADLLGVHRHRCGEVGLEVTHLDRTHPRVAGTLGGAAGWPSPAGCGADLADGGVGASPPVAQRPPQWQSEPGRPDDGLAGAPASGGLDEGRDSVRGSVPTGTMLAPMCRSARGESSGQPHRCPGAPGFRMPASTRDPTKTLVTGSAAHESPDGLGVRTRCRMRAFIGLSRPTPAPAPDSARRRLGGQAVRLGDQGGHDLGLGDGLDHLAPDEDLALAVAGGDAEIGLPRLPGTVHHAAHDGDPQRDLHAGPAPR